MITIAIIAAIAIKYVSLFGPLLGEGAMIAGPRGPIVLGDLFLEERVALRAGDLLVILLFVTFFLEVVVLVVFLFPFFATFLFAILSPLIMNLLYLLSSIFWYINLPFYVLCLLWLNLNKMLK